WARASREAEISGPAASLVGAPGTTASLTGTTADEASSRTSTLIPTTRTTSTTRTTPTPAATRTAATATCLRAPPTLNTASGRTVRNFFPVTEERFDFVLASARRDGPAVRAFVAELARPETRAALRERGLLAC